MKKNHYIMFLSGLIAITLLGLASVSLALTVENYLPHEAGDQWSYINNNHTTETTTIGSPVMLPSGIATIPWTTVDSSQSGYSVTYHTIDGNGFRRHQEYTSSLYISGYGYTSFTGTYSPALSICPPYVSVGDTITSTGTATMAYTNIATVAMAYSATTRIVGFETVSNHTGTESWSALKVIFSLTVSGTVEGQFISATASYTYWMVEGLGIVKSYGPNASNTMETWELSSTNVTIPTIPATTAANRASLLSKYVFDVDYYLARNDDVAAAFGGNREAAANHWVNYGFYEGRKGSPFFSVTSYIYYNSDLVPYYGNSYDLYLNHFLNYGITEGRATGIYDGRTYLYRNPDLASAFGYNYQAALDHYMAYGIYEGRQASEHFDPQEYLSANSDLQAAYGNNYNAATMHYLIYGQFEGRSIGNVTPASEGITH